MKGINKFIGIGFVGKDPEVRHMPSGGAVTNISIAVSEKWKDKNTGEAKESTEWINIVFFNRLAEIAGQYLKKGSKVYIEGQLRTRKWTDKESGQDRYTTEIVAREMQMLGDRPQQGDYQMNQAPQQPHAQQQQPQQPQQTQQQFPDDDIPF